MSIHNSQNKIGELWLRTLNGSVMSSNEILSSVYIKYSTVDPILYQELQNNEIIRFDVFYDVIYIETERGYFFEKIKFDPFLNQVLPYNNDNNFIYSFQTPINYWFDEDNFKIYYVQINSGIQQANTFVFFVTVREFDIKTATNEIVLQHSITVYSQQSVSWGGKNANIEKPHICYNKDSRNYNISFIVRNNQNTIGLVSMILNKNEEFRITKIDALLPFFTNCTLTYANYLSANTQNNMMLTQ